MKSIKIFAFVLLSFFALNTHAQMHIGATIGAQVPMGDFGDAMNPGFGINFFGKYSLNESMAVGLNVGYHSFGSDLEGFSCTMMPVTGLFEYYLGSGAMKPYLGVDLGFYKYSFDMEFMGISSSVSETYLGFAPTGGILYGLNDKMSLVANLKYNVVLSEDSSTGYLGINAGLVYQIK